MVTTDKDSCIEPAERDAFMAHINELKEKLGSVMGWAYQVIGNLLVHGDMFDRPVVQRILDYSATNDYSGKFLPVDFLPTENS